MAKATAEAIMAELHVETTERILANIRDPESDIRYVQIAVKFLSDNKVFMLPEISNELGELDKHLAKKRKRKFGKQSNITDMATHAAMAMND